MKVLVTGGSGKVGQFTVRDLQAAGHDVTNIDRARPDGGGKFIQVDLTNAGEVVDAMAQVRPDAVCHIGANPSPSGFPRQQTFANNVQSTYVVMQAAGDLGTVSRFIYASSEMATGWLTTEALPERIPFDETDRATTPNAYALSKYLGEVIADSLSVRYPNMAFVSLRINNVITPETYSWLADRRAQYPNGGSGNFWSYIDVRDVASAFRAAIEGQTTGHEVFLIAARDTCLDVPIRTALLDRYGQAAVDKVTEGHGDFQSAFDCRKIERILGWTAQHSWRDEPHETVEP